MYLLPKTEDVLGFSSDFMEIIISDTDKDITTFVDNTFILKFNYFFVKLIS